MTSVSLSVKSQRLLKRLGVLAALEGGDAPVRAGPIYASRTEPAARLQLAFLYDEARRLCVGTARDDGDGWRVVEAEPFSLRALGYYQRRLKRVGDFLAAGAPVPGR
jgi:hypothetical protein